MKITAIHGQLHQGSTYNITRLFLKKLGGENAEITEFFMPETPLLPVPVVAIVFSRVRTIAPMRRLCNRWSGRLRKQKQVSGIRLPTGSIGRKTAGSAGKSPGEKNNLLT